MREINLFIALVALIPAVEVMGQGDKEEAVETLTQYSLDAKYGLVDYLMEAKVHLESSPGSVLLLETNTEMRVFAKKGLRFDSFDCKAKQWDSLFGGDELRKNDWGPFTRGSRKTIEVEGAVWDVVSEGGKDHYSPNDEQYDKIGQALSVRRFHPFEWPLIAYQSLKQGGSGSPLESLSNKYLCEEGVKRDGKLVGTWRLKKLPATRDRQRVEIWFSDDLPVKSRSVVELLRGDAKEMFLAEVETKWDRSRDEPVPVRVDAKLNTQKQGMPEVFLTVDFKWHFPGDEKYEAEKKRLEEIVSKLPKRAIAGTDQPASGK